jgi:hypothetical protein
VVWGEAFLNMYVSKVVVLIVLARYSTCSLSADEGTTQIIVTLVTTLYIDACPHSMRQVALRNYQRRNNPYRESGNRSK